MKGYGVLLANLRSNAGLSLEGLARLVSSSKSTLSRLENDEIVQPFRGSMRKLVLSLAQVLCTSRRETERYLELAGVDRSFLSETEEIQLGFAPLVAPGSPDELATLERLASIYGELLEQLIAREAEVGIASSPPHLKLKIQELTNTLHEVQRRLDILHSRKEPGEADVFETVPVHYAEALEGKIVVGHHYGEELNADIPSAGMASALLPLNEPITFVRLSTTWPLLSSRSAIKFAVPLCVSLMVLKPLLRLNSCVAACPFPLKLVVYGAVVGLGC